MALRNRVRETTTSTGQGAITPAGAVSQFRAFSAAGLSVGDTFPLLIETSSHDWEISIGTWQSGGTIARTLVDSSTGALLNLDGTTAFINMTTAAHTTLDRTDAAAIEAMVTTWWNTLPTVQPTASGKYYINGGQLARSGYT